jgi:tRNA (mo5U34)-methyltransferase
LLSSEQRRERGGLPTGDTVFDRAASLAVNEARERKIKEVIESLRTLSPVVTAVDIGCGVGTFSRLLADLGLAVMGVDGRLENVTEARRRHPAIRFAHWDVEDATICGLGAFDLVLCTGLLYHLENPFRAVRNIVSMIGQYAILESVVHADSRSTAILFDECREVDQGLNYISLVPSESTLVRMFTASGLDHLYRVSPQPDFHDFHGTLLRKKQRIMLVGSRKPIELSNLQPVEVAREHVDPWERSGVLTTMARLARKAYRSFGGVAGTSRLRP